ncbi:DEKNAAC100780 [Brettanomyces naardenensis]|uniref:DEKNAAC100780 n=1 Tax=Brettanomyces naardenensis TaxID=13370 RepID=A0A448YG29_BRENA|nr:DEKNAAC100780 [Brettanomyces naardenensis]
MSSNEQAERLLKGSALEADSEGVPPESSMNKDSPIYEFEIEEPEYAGMEERSSDSGRPEFCMYQGHRVIIETKDISLSLKLKLQFLSCNIFLIVLGLNDQTLGAIMEYVLSDYKIDRIKVSYLFLTGTFGYVPASFLNHYLIYNFGLYKVYFAGELFLIIGCCLYGLKSPYPCLILGSLINGFGAGLSDCSVNIFVGNLKHSNQLLGIMHSSYGLGCLVSPALAIFLISKGFPWPHFYFLVAFVGLVNLVLVYLTFKNETQWKYKYVSELDRKASGDNGDETSAWETLHNRYVLFYSFALFMYIGSELSVGVWLFNYVFNIQHVTEKHSSFITSGYWACLTLGRFCLGFITGRFFEHFETRAIVLYCSLVAICCFGFWAFSYSIVVQTTCIFFMGFFVGPLFGTSVVIAIHTLPVRFATSGISLIAGLGGSGAAVVPPIMGFIAETFGNGHGEGLVYFPAVVLFTFTFAALLWISFYTVHRKTLEAQRRLGQ